jgi:ComF family protein
MWQTLVNLIFPPKCIFCGELMEIGTRVEICRECYVKIPFSSLPPNENGFDLQSSDWYDGAICVCSYTGLIKDVVGAYKFKDKPSHFRALGILLSEKVIKMTNAEPFDIITCVPLHRSREADRGYNQSALLAGVLARKTGISLQPRLLRRIRNTDAQSRLNRENRLANVRGAFQVSDPSRVSGKRILLVDDVMTTGSTINECSKILKDAGATRVVAAVIASGRTQ